MHDVKSLIFQVVQDLDSSIEQFKEELTNNTCLANIDEMTPNLVHLYPTATAPLLEKKYTNALAQQTMSLIVLENYLSDHCVAFFVQTFAASVKQHFDRH